MPLAGKSFTVSIFRDGGRLGTVADLPNTFRVSGICNCPFYLQFKRSMSFVTSSKLCFVGHDRPRLRRTAMCRAAEARDH
jgi:hypothetical protein